jgi:hypothetical protein
MSWAAQALWKLELDDVAPRGRANGFGNLELDLEDHFADDGGGQWRRVRASGSVGVGLCWRTMQARIQGAF